MSSFKEHLLALASGSGVPTEDDRDWDRLLDGLELRTATSASKNTSQDNKTWAPRKIPAGVLETYTQNNFASTSRSSVDNATVSGGTLNTLLDRFLSNPDRKQLAQSLSQILNSSRSDEIISGEVLELIGYDDIDLAMDIIASRYIMGASLDSLDMQTTTVSPTNQISSPENGSARPKMFKGKGKHHDPDGQVRRVPLTEEEAMQNLEASLQAASDRPLYTGTAEPEAPVYPNVYSSGSGAGNVLSHLGSKYMLPIGTTREQSEEWEEVTIPPARVVPPRITERLIEILKLDSLARGSFPGYSSLNRIQSIVYPAAYTTNENLLICAPTGAGKTDVAMLTILRVLDQYSTKGKGASTTNLATNIRRDEFKIIYVAPMKALASEITRKLGKRLKWLSIIVKELTGDMQLTRAEIAETQIIVTTPEKWDVVTRKPTGDGELASKVKLLIIDEVHLLNEDRGAVIETIVARTLRQVESTQSLIRVVGLSATLPNYLDVATFLGVSPYHGLFFFDSSFRPVPLEQHFLGVKGKAGSPTSRRNLDRATFKKVSELVGQGHQVMVFVHARKETVKSAQSLRESILAEGSYEDFDPSDHPMFDQFRREIGTSRNKEMKQLFDSGFGIHHAGMLRSDRNMMERMFEARAIKVLCTTATLAWGVNLPAHAVIIKGTQVYDAGRGAFVDLSVLDVLQIFGRAGRPGMEDRGEGYICTTEDKLDHYLDAITAQHPIESQFVSGMIDSLNAEIALGTVANVSEGVQWVGYTYLFVRMKKNPAIYGIPYDDLADDPNLGARREHLITVAAKSLAAAQMIRFDLSKGSFSITDLGRIAAKYYIRHTSIEIFNKELRPTMSEADVLAMICMSTEFNQIQVRENELDELKILMDEIIPCQVKGGTDTSQGKVNILLQGYISNAYIDDFALVSDTAYAAQNGGRVARALLEIAISRKWANASAVLMSISKAIEKRMWAFEHPLKQFKLSPDVLYNLQRWADELSPAELAIQSSEELGNLIHLNHKHGAALLGAAQQFPSALLDYKLRPLSSELLKIEVHITRAFEWNSKIHGSSQPYWLWVEDSKGENIFQWAHLQFRQGTTAADVDFIIPIREPQPPSVTLRFLSDQWLGAEDEVPVSFEKLVMPTASLTRTAVLDIPFLPVSVLQHPVLESLYTTRLRVFNGIQTQCLWSVYNNRQHVLLAAPASCGKSICGQLAVWQAIVADPNKCVLVIAPLDSDARDWASALRTFAGPMGIQVRVHASRAKVHLPRGGKFIDVVTPAALLGWLDDSKDHNYLSSLSLVLCEGLELLDAQYELAMAILLHATESLPVRFVGLTASLNDTLDLSQWLGVSSESLFDFKPTDRDQPFLTTSQPFTIPHSPALFKAMIKPAHSTLRSLPGSEAAIVFVPSRSQCRTISNDLITQCAIEMDTRGFLGEAVLPDDLEVRLAKLRDRSLFDALMRGIGVLHDGIGLNDRLLTLELFADDVLRVLVVPRETCWTLPVRAALVVVLGTQYIQVNPSSTSSTMDDRALKDYSVHELVRMQGLAVRHGRSGHFHLLCQAEQRDTYMRFLEEGLPLESALLPPALEIISVDVPTRTKVSPTNDDVLCEWLVRRRKSGSIRGKQDMMDVLSFTFLWHRMKSNPTYYGAQQGKREAHLSRVVDRLFEITNPVVVDASVTPSALVPTAKSGDAKNDKPTTGA